MDFGSAFAGINWLAVVVAAVVAFVIGGAWYSQGVFGKVWMRASGLTEEDARAANMGVVFGGALLLELVAAAVLAASLGADATLASGARAGLFIGVAWVGTAFGVVYLFEQRPMSHFLVNAGYHAVTFTVMGAILGIWH